ncbi:MAG: hypothetical protein J6P64_00270 [Bacteroidales bacterium]|jgi:uncharacterized Fe-S cluster-containing radical SAM superfamily enzyme|nr:hypothetical protein [Bacteroidales bacterium]
MKNDKKYNTDNIQQLFWACNEGFKRGRDPMGIQNCSITVYGLLLPGLTNLTGRLRYYSFYCWLLYEFEKEYRNSGLERSVKDQYNFIRRSELAMAFIMEGRGVGSVVGSMHVANNKYILSKGRYDLISSADIDSKHEKYWKYTTGAFGQYYLGSLIYLQLVGVLDDSFGLLERGRNLAEAYIKSVGEKSRKLFLSCIKEGCLSKNNVDELEEICLDRIRVGSPEWTMLNDIIVRKDLSGMSFRRDSVYLMLKAISNKVEVKRFTTKLFLEYKEGDAETLLGWHYYYLCEALHYCLETLFWMILSNASAKNYCPVDSFLDICQNSILDEKFELTEYKDYSLSKIISYYDSRIDNRLDNLVATVRTGKYEEASSKAIGLLICLYHKVLENKSLYINFERNHGINQQFGYLTGFVKRYIENNLNLDVKTFTRNVVRLVMADHTTSACRKMGRGQSDLRKFLLEDGMVVSVEIWKPQFTNPRTDSLVAFLEDLSYVKDGQITDIGAKFIDEYEKQ